VLFPSHPLLDWLLILKKRKTGGYFSRLSSHKLVQRADLSNLAVHGRAREKKKSQMWSSKCILLVSGLLNCVKFAESKASSYTDHIWADHVLVRDASLFPSSQREKFSNKNVVVFGDSLARRLTATIAMYLNVTEDYRTAFVDFNAASLLSEGGHSRKNWEASIVPVEGKRIRLSFVWLPKFPPPEEGKALEVVREVSLSTVIFLVSIFHQKGHMPGGLLNSSSVDLTLPRKFLENLCANLRSGIQLIVVLSPPANHVAISWRLKPRDFPDMNEKKLKRLNTKSGVLQRRATIERTNSDYHAKFQTLYRTLAAHDKCKHVSLEFMDHFALFQHRTDGRHRNSGDTPFHLGNIARVHRMLDVFRVMP